MSETLEMTLSDLVAEAQRLTATGMGERSSRLYADWIATHATDPQLYIAHFNHACLLSELGEPQTAMQSLNACLALNPDFLPASINLGGLLERAGAVPQAIEQWQGVAQRVVAVTGAAIAYKLTALRQIARVLSDHHKPAMAEAMLRQCLDIQPEQRDVIEQFMALRLVQCAWPALPPGEPAERRRMLRSTSPLSMLAYTDDPLLHLGLAHHYARCLVDESQDLARHDRRDAPIALKERRLRIGYISSDLRDHAIGTLMAEVFELHDRSRVEITAYYCGPPSNAALQARIQSAVEHWVDLRPLSDDEAAARIAADGVDILVDVNGYTRDARTAIFARRPAPVQINWLGYPGTLGTPWHHYIIADSWIIPTEAELYYSERVLRLPCYQPNDRKRAIAETPTRAAAGLPEQGFVFCCFNASQKLSRFTMQRWMDILLGVPGSVLWLLDSGEEMRANLRAFAAARGIGEERVIFAPKLANPEHLARYRLADLFLDSAPYGAHTTASDALWLGVPVLTLSGRGFASRVCGSLVRAAGLPAMVCATPDAYVSRAIALAHEPQELARHRQTLAARRQSCDLFNMEKLVKRLESLFEQTARAHNAGRTPQPCLANLEAYLEIGTALDHEAEEMLALPDYHGLYAERLARQHAKRPLSADGRLWSGGGR
jgi:predicted O-linked N-acetylglucosamine transferase (SPINDLY family)